LLAKYKSKGFRVLLINTLPSAASDAELLIRNLGYSFTLVHAPQGWKHAMGSGANFLLDSHGRVVYHPHLNGTREMQKADQIIKSILHPVNAKGEATVITGGS
jgi:hypothetical protein